MNKLLTIESLIKEVKLLQKENKKIGFCCGVYDLLHPGHMSHLEQAKRLCEILIVAVTCDKYVKEKKGNGRPIYNEKQRVFTVNQLKSVDYAFVSPFKTAIELILMIKPDYYIKGSDYKDKKDGNFILEVNAVESLGGKVKHTKYVQPSTTEVINRIKKI